MDTARTYFADKGEASGRMYDPVMSSFLSVDRYLQDPSNSQNFNRYAYCAHNPLRYTDPTGWSNQPVYNPNSAPPCNPPGHTTFYSDDANDMLWGHSSHSCNFSSGFCNGDRVTSGEYTEGNGLKNKGKNGSNVSAKSCYYLDPMGKIKHIIGIGSKTEFDDMGFEGTYLGITYTDLENQIYYSLLGYAIDMTQCDGKAGDIARKIDLAFLAYEKDKLGNPNKDPLDVYVENPTTVSIDEIEFNSCGTNIHAFSYDGNPLYIHVFDGSSGKKCNSMNAAFCGLESADKWKRNSTYHLSKSTTFIPGYNLYFNNPDANPRDWRIMMVLPTKEKRDLFFEKYNRTFGYW